MSAPCWTARTVRAPTDCWLAAQLRDGAGRDVGWLAAWRGRDRPVPGALRADPSFFDPNGDEAWLSVAWAPDGFDLLFDDLAVQRARQIVLEGEPPAAVTTLSRDASHIGGALTARRGARATDLLAREPFARLLPAQVVHVGPALVGRGGPPASVILERYAGAPWPAAGFAT